MIQVTARNSDQPGNVCDDRLVDSRRVTTPRCIVDEDSGMEISLKTTELPKDPIAMSTNTAELPVRGHRPDGCHSGPLLPGAGRRQTLTLGGLHSFRMPSFIQGWPQNYIASIWTQYSFGNRLTWSIWTSCPQLPPASFSRERLIRPVAFKVAF